LYSDWRVIIALGEIASSLLFLFPKTNKLRTILLSSYMGGAIIVHMISNIPIIMPSAILIIIWLAEFIRNPELYKYT
jgi:hypothetical protein